MENSKVYIIILQYNNWLDTIECLHSISTILYDDYNIVIVDNNSSNDSLAKLKQWLVDNKEKSIKLNETVLIENIVNNGYAGGNNLGIKYIIEKNDYDYVWILNNDTVVDKLALYHLVKIASQNKQIGICGSKILYYDRRDTIQSIGSKVNYTFGYVSNISDPTKVETIDSVMGASFFITNKCISTVGFLPEEYFLFLEESDYCIMAVKYGFKIKVALDSIVFHKEGCSTGGSSDYRNRSESADLLSFRSRIIFGRKYVKSMFGLYAGLLVSVILRIKRGQIQRAVKFLDIMMKSIIKPDDFIKTNVID